MQTDPNRDPRRGEAPPNNIDAALREAAVSLARANQPTLYRPPTFTPPPTGVRPELEQIVAEVIAPCVHEFQRATALRQWVAAIPRRFPEGGQSTRDGYWESFSAFTFGGSEEQVIANGSAQADELARVLVVLARIAGLPGRIVYLGTAGAIDRHTVAELYLGGRWSVFDPISDRCFAWMKHGYASAWDIRQMPALVDQTQDHGRLRYVDSRYYHQARIVEYDPWTTAYQYPEWRVSPFAGEHFSAGGVNLAEGWIGP